MTTNTTNPTDPSFESPEDSAAWDATLESVDSEELIKFMIADAEDELAKGQYTEDTD